jgi:hypothetical protein
VKSAIYCGHANESPQYERLGNALVCACPENCYCKHEGGCKNLRREGKACDLYDGNGRLIASCTTVEAVLAAGRLMGL